jgi:hypothetical protein
MTVPTEEAIEEKVPLVYAPSPVKAPMARMTTMARIRPCSVTD